MALRLNTSEKSEISDIRRFWVAFWELPSSSQSVLWGAPWVMGFCLVLSSQFNEKESKFFNPGKEELFGVLLLLGGADL